MKYFVKFFVVTLFLLVSTYATAEQKIVYIDMKYVLNNSDAGKGAQTFLQKSFKENQKKITDSEKMLKNEEKDLLSKKATLSKEDYEKKTNELRKKVASYQAERRGALDKIAKKRADFRQELLKKLNPIINAYIQENAISMVIDKKNVVFGNDSLDITKIIVEKLNKELPSLNLK